MKMYIFRDVFTNKLYKTYDISATDAKIKVSKLKNIKLYNLARVKPQEKVSHA